MMWERKTTCCFSGHRLSGLPVGGSEQSPAAVALKASLRKTIEAAVQAGYRTFITGMATGFDFWAAEAVLQKKKDGWPLVLVAAIPFAGHDASLQAISKRRYHEILRGCDKTEVLAPRYHRGAYRMRNHYMVDRSSLLICCMFQSASGTGQTVSYAQMQGLEIINIAQCDEETAGE